MLRPTWMRPTRTGRNHIRAAALLFALSLAAIPPASAEEGPVTGTESAVECCHVVIDPDDTPSNKPCGVVTQPVCWVARFACGFYRTPVENVSAHTLSCEAQP